MRSRGGGMLASASLAAILMSAPAGAGVPMLNGGSPTMDSGSPIHEVQFGIPDLSGIGGLGGERPRTRHFRGGYPHKNITFRGRCAPWARAAADEERRGHEIKAERARVAYRMCINAR